MREKFSQIVKDIAPAAWHRLPHSRNASSRYGALEVLYRYDLQHGTCIMSPPISSACLVSWCDPQLLRMLSRLRPCPLTTRAPKGRKQPLTRDLSVQVQPSSTQHAAQEAFDHGDCIPGEKESGRWDVSSDGRCQGRAFREFDPSGQVRAHCTCPDPLASSGATCAGSREGACPVGATP